MEKQFSFAQDIWEELKRLLEELKEKEEWSETLKQGLTKVDQLLGLRKETWLNNWWSRLCLKLKVAGSYEIKNLSKEEVIKTLESSLQELPRQYTTLTLTRSIDQVNMSFKPKIIQQEENHKLVESNNLAILAPLHEAQTKLQRTWEIVYEQLAAIQSMIIIFENKDGKFSLEEQEDSYQKKMDTLETNFTKSFEDVINAREQAFIDGKVVEVTPEVKEKLVADEMKTIKELITHQRRFISDLANQMKTDNNKEMKDRLEVLKILYDTKAKKEKQKLSDENQLSSILTEKTRITSQMQNTMIEIQKAHRKLIEDHKRQVTAQNQSIHHYASMGNLSEVKKLYNQTKTTIFGGEKIKFINQVDEEGKAALHHACLHAHLPVIEFLLESQADCKIKDLSGYTCFHSAMVLSQPNTHLVLDMLSRYAKTDLLTIRGPYERTLLHSACHFGNLYAAKWLFERYPNFINMQEVSQLRTPLHEAASRVVAFLLEKKADPFIENKGGETAFVEAVLSGKKEIIQVFLEYGIFCTKKDLQAIRTLSTKYPENFLDTMIEPLKGIVSFLKGEN